MNPALPGGASTTDTIAEHAWSAGGRVGYAYVPYPRLQQGTDDAPNPSQLSIGVHLATLQAFAAAPTGTSLDLQLPAGTLATRTIGGERTDDGVGDLEVRVRQSLARWIPAVATGVTLGLVVPTGAYVARAGAANLPPEAVALTLGRGVAWWLAELDARRQLAPRVRVFGQLSARRPLHRTDDEFAWGREVRATASARIAIVPRVAALASTDVQWRGRATEPDPFAGGRVESASVGGWQWSVSPGIAVELGDVALTAGVRVPLHQDVVGNQLVAGVGGFLAVAYARRVSPPPRRPAIAKGKITVVEYWASWCKPCAAIAAELERVAPSWPDVEVIRVDATAWPGDGAPALPAGAKGLPVVEIFDDTGTRRSLLVGDPARGVVEAVEQLRRSKGSTR